MSQYTPSTVGLLGAINLCLWACTGIIEQQDSLPTQNGLPPSTIPADPGNRGEPPITEQECLDQAETLSDAADCRGLLLGTSLDLVQGEPEYDAIVDREFNTITPGNYLKWGPLQPIRGEWNFTNADQCIERAQARAGSPQYVKGHTLVWYYQLPGWVDNSLTSNELSTALHQHIQTTVTRYKGKVSSWDVVNEAMGFGTCPNQCEGQCFSGICYRDTIFSRKLGPDYIAQAFRWAHEADPSAVLIYNEILNAHATVAGVERNTFLLMKKLLAENVPVHGVGLQTHINAHNAPRTQDMRNTIRRFTSLGLKVNISEIDVGIRYLSGSQGEKLNTQRAVYYEMTRACLAEPGCYAFSLWGFTDKHSWIDSFYGPDDPLIFDESYQKKPAYDGIMRALKNKPLSTNYPDRIANGGFETELSGEWSAWNGASIQRSQITSSKGSWSLKCRPGTPGNWQCPAQFINTATLPNQRYYRLRADLRCAQGEANSEASLQLYFKDDDGVHFITASRKTISDQSWTTLDGRIFLSAKGAITEAAIYAGPGGDITLFADEISLTQY
ncbi:MAG: endo-1,4-beta-xylanase [Myxococcales bacterium]|nr:MAG: endo-1,4-beta-xylanase [Myxococcales bacterium]